jgi:hypothetical protein
MPHPPEAAAWLSPRSAFVVPYDKTILNLCTEHIDLQHFKVVLDAEVSLLISIALQYTIALK